MNPSEAVAAAVDGAPEALFVSSLGTATSALRRASADGPHLYLGGSMGCGLATALGVAEARPDRTVVAIIGDGDLLMGAGSLWSLAGLRPANLVLVILEDGHYSITGGQELIAAAFGAVSGALPGLTTIECLAEAEVVDAVRTARRPAVVVARIDDPSWPGPSPFVDPPAVAARFRENVAGTT